MTLAGNDDTTVVPTIASFTNDGGTTDIGDPENNPTKWSGDSVSIEANLSTVARCLIIGLQGDFRAEGKTTCRDCLRTKTLPCSRVVEVADGPIFSKNDKTGNINNSSQDSFSVSQILGKAYEILLDDYTKFSPPSTTNTIPYDTDVVATHPSSLRCMNRISVVLRFVQLLLLLSKRQQQQQQQKASSFPSAAEVNKMMVSLLNDWTRGVCEFSKFCEAFNSTERAQKVVAAMDEDGDTNSSDNDCLTADATQSLEYGPVFCYAFYSLLGMNEYIQTRGALIVPLWKGLCELTKMIVLPPSASSSASDVSDGGNNRDETQNYDQDVDINDWRDLLPHNILGDAIRVLGDFLQEGKGRLELETFQRCLGGREEGQGGGGGGRLTHTSDARIAFQGRIVVFMVTRMAHLLRVYFSVRENGSRRSEKNSSSSTPYGRRMEPILNGVWMSLLGLRGMAAALQLLHSAGLNGFEKDKEIDVTFLKVYCEIAAKAGKCITYTILQKHQQRRRILVPGLESLLLSNMVTQGNDSFVEDEYRECHPDYQEEVRSKLIRMSVLARTIGKVSALQHLLEVATSDGTCCRIAGNVEPLLATIENLHCTSVPQCLSACVIAVRCSKKTSRNVNTIVTTPTTIVLGSLKIMARTLREIEASSEFMASPKRDIFYRLLVRWLSGSAYNSDRHEKIHTNTNSGTASTESGQQEHPLSRELVLSLLHAHIIGYGDNSQNGGGFQTRLLSYMAKLLMDARTRTTLRRNIGALFIRLQSSPAASDSSMACVTATELIEKEFIVWLNHNRSRQRPSKKRKRIQSGQHFTTGLDQQDVIAISRVLGAGRGMSDSFFSSSSSEEYQRVMRNEFARLSSECSDETSKSGKALLALAERNSLLLAWLERYIAMGPTSSFQTIRRTTGLDLLIDIVKPVLSAVSGLRFKVGHNGDGTELLKKKVMLYSAAMRLSVTWATVFGEEGKLPIEKVCLLIKHSVSKDPWQQPNIEDSYLSVVEDQQSILKFESLNLLGSIGKAIPNNCSERVLRIIRRAFVGFLSSTNWAVSSLGISSVILFASDLSASHQQILPLCLPKVSMGLFQARVSGNIWKGTDSDDNSNSIEETIFEIVDRMARHLNRYTVTTGVGNSLRNMLPSTATASIALGSYVLEMPTQDDRTATVIFPPGPKSLQDIHYMLGGMGDEAQMTAQLLKRAVVTPSGVFKFLLVPS